MSYGYMPYYNGFYNGLASGRANYNPHEVTGKRDNLERMKSEMFKDGERKALEVIQNSKKRRNVS